MDKCYELFDTYNEESYCGMFKNRADAEEMCLACSEEESYKVFLQEYNKWGTDLNLALLVARDALWRIEIIEHNLF